MIGNERVVAAIPARGGSKGVPRKNVRELGNKPLLAWSIDVAKETACIDRVVVTTDDDEIATVARDYAAEVVMRPEQLATDDALVIDAIRHLVTTLRDDGEQARYLTMLEPTCPFREPEDIQASVELLATEDFDSVATFTEAELNPHRAWRIADTQPEPMVKDADPWQPRQKLPDAYELNGGAYTFEMDALPETGPAMIFGNCGAVTMPSERSIDIDTPLDLEFARLVAKRRD